MKFDDATLYATHKNHLDALMQIENVYGVGIGLKHVDGKRTDQLAIVVYVERKIPESELSAGQVIPATLDGVPTDVVEAPRPQLATHNDPLRDKQRPLFGGLQIAAGSVYGTLGFIADTTAGVAVAVSNEHVIGALNSAVWQPTSPTQIGVTGASILNEFVDAAYLSLSDGITVSATVGKRTEQGVDEKVNVTGSYSPTPSDLPYAAWKTGRTTATTFGEITSVSISVEYPKNNLVMHNQLRIEGNKSGVMALPGDSGSAVMDNSNRVVGLVWGIETAQGLVAWANAIAQVEQYLQLSGPKVSQAADPQPPAEAFNWVPVAMDSLDKLAKSRNGAALAALLKDHAPTIEELIESDDHVAVAWNRNHGHEILIMSLNNIRYKEVPFPAKTLEGHDVVKALDAFGAALKKRGRSELAEATPALRESLVRLIDKPYDEVFGGAV